MDENADDLDLDRMLEGRLRVPEPPAGLRESLLLRTSRMVEMRARRRWWTRRGLAGVAAALLFGAGFVSARLVDEARPLVGSPPIAAVPREPAGPVVSVEPAPVEPDEIRRKVALAPSAERGDLLRRAGDAYLARGDLDGAIECYRQVMEIEGSAPRAAAGREDAWLLAALRRSRENENRRGS
jgi:hypothetical protein